MSERGFAYFIKRPRRIEDLMCHHPDEQEREYEVVKTIALPAIDFENFITDMVADRQFLEDNAALCGSDGTTIRCLLIQRLKSSGGVLVVPDGAWVAWAAAILCNSGLANCVKLC